MQIPPAWTLSFKYVVSLLLQPNAYLCKSTSFPTGLPRAIPSERHDHGPALLDTSPRSIPWPKHHVLHSSDQYLMEWTPDPANSQQVKSRAQHMRRVQTWNQNEDMQPASMARACVRHAVACTCM
jgi:hypothetical protein